MHTPDLTNTRIYNRFGVTGVKLFAITWFPIMYLIIGSLFACTMLSLWYLPSRDRVVVGIVCCLGSTIATIMLTRMLRDYRLGMRALKHRDLLHD